MTTLRNKLMLLTIILLFPLVMSAQVEIKGLGDSYSVNQKIKAWYKSHPGVYTLNIEGPDAIADISNATCLGLPTKLGEEEPDNFLLLSCTQKMVK